MLAILNSIYIKNNKRNDKPFDNRGCSLFFLMGIFLKHLWLIPNILKWQDCKIFYQASSFTHSLQNQPPELFCKKGVPKNLRNLTRKHLCWSLFQIKLQIIRPATLLERDSNTCVFLWNFANFSEHLFWKTSANDCFCPS